MSSDTLVTILGAIDLVLAAGFLTRFSYRWRVLGTPMGAQVAVMGGALVVWLASRLIARVMGQPLPDLWWIITLTLMLVGFLFQNLLLDRLRQQDRADIRSDLAHDLALSALRTSPDATIVIDEHGTMVLVSTAAESLFGHHTTQMQGHAIEMLIPERLRDQHRAHRRTYFTNPSVRPMGYPGLHLVGLHRNGDEVELLINLAPVVTTYGSFAIATIRRR